jgi:4-hydroxy-2-oxoheptanedioate aldolase
VGIGRIRECIGEEDAVEPVGDGGGRPLGPLNEGRLRGRVAAGEPTVGIFVGAGSPVTAEVCAAVGFDWLLLDLEHGAAGEQQVGTTVAVAAAYGVPTVVRVENEARIRIGRVLDAGAAGVMLPRLDTAEQVRAAVRHLRYPPQGDRGIATYTRSCRFGFDTDALQRANDQVLGVVQIESVRAVEAVEEIAAVDGVDVLFVGPRDLTHALGVPGRVDAPEYRAALQRVLAAAQAAGVTAGVLAASREAAEDYVAEGFGFVGVGSDSSFVASAARAAAAQLITAN